MARKTTYTQHLRWQRFFSLALLLLIGTISLHGQKTNRRGLWAETGFNVGGTLSDKTKLGLPNDGSFGGNVYLTAGVHLPQLDGLQAGFGVYRAGYGNPNELRYNGVHLDLRYAPFKNLKHLQVSTMIGLPISNVDMTIVGDTKYKSKVYGTLALGWELPKLLGKFGLNPAIGVSYTSFDYERELEGFVSKKGSSSQATVFFRLGLRLN